MPHDPQLPPNDPDPAEPHLPGPEPDPAPPDIIDPPAPNPMWA
jgi:hypothetical protein